MRLRFLAAGAGIGGILGILGHLLNPFQAVGFVFAALAPFALAAFTGAAKTTTA